MPSQLAACTSAAQARIRAAASSARRATTRRCASSPTGAVPRCGGAPVRCGPASDERGRCPPVRLRQHAHVRRRRRSDRRRGRGDERRSRERGEGDGGCERRERALQRSGGCMRGLSSMRVASARRPLVTVPWSPATVGTAGGPPKARPRIGPCVNAPIGAARRRRRAARRPPTGERSASGRRNRSPASVRARPRRRRGHRGDLLGLGQPRRPGRGRPTRGRRWGSSRSSAARRCTRPGGSRARRSSASDTERRSGRVASRSPPNGSAAHGLPRRGRTCRISSRTARGTPSCAPPARCSPTTALLATGVPGDPANRARRTATVRSGMVILLAFAFLAGAATALSPCVLPVLPAVLSAGGAGGRRRPLGVVFGLSATFTITIVGVAEVVGGVGLGTDPLRFVAVLVLAGFGIALLFPRVAAALEAPLARLSRYGPRSRGDGFWSGVIVGAALGFVYTPCAGPILAAVITVSAATGRTVAVAIAYALGSAVVLLALTLGGRRLLERVRRAGRGAVVQRVMGGVMLVTALLIVTNVDVSFDQLVARQIPNVNLTAGLERSTAVAIRLHDLRPQTANGFKEPVPAGIAPGPQGLPKLGRAPEFVHTQRWFNTPGGRPAPLRSLRGRVVLVDFWTYTCINCLRTLPYLEAWDRRYRDAGLTIVGVHTPEFAFEHDAGNVGRAVKRLGIRYPVVQDNDNGTWDAYANMYWPADYLVDAGGQVRYASIGEGDYDKTENAIRLLLAEAGHRRLGGAARPEDSVAPSKRPSPETYLGTRRAQGGIAGEPRAGENEYPSVDGKLPVNTFAFGGTWKVGEQAATAVRGATIDATVQARNVYLVRSPPPSGRGTVQVLVDGKPARAGVAGADVRGGRVAVTRQRLYTLVVLPPQ